uniref:(northern house mosquito) hypothetical protein n=1 Tax=Culex pipiens TaxID=7175 RepID=A0A8D8KCU8_CULPI
MLKLLGHGTIRRSDLRAAFLAVAVPEHATVLLRNVVAQTVRYLRDELASWQNAQEQGLRVALDVGNVLHPLAVQNQLSKVVRGCVELGGLAVGFFRLHFDVLHGGRYAFQLLFLLFLLLLLGSFVLLNLDLQRHGELLLLAIVSTVPTSTTRCTTSTGGMTTTCSSSIRSSPSTA